MKPAFEQVVEAPVLPLHPQNLRAQHRSEAQRDERRHHHRARHGDAELVEQPPGVPLQEGERREDRDQRDGGHDHREGDLARPIDRGFRRILAQLLLMPEGVLQHDDGVIHHDADGQDQGEQRQIVDREAERVHESERRDDRGRDREARDQGAAQVPQEDEDDEHDQEGGEDQSLLRLADRRADEIGAVEGEQKLHARGEGPADRFEFLLDRIGPSVDALLATLGSS